MSRTEQRVYSDRRDLTVFQSEKLLHLWREGGAVLAYGDKIRAEINEYIAIPDSTNPVTAALTAHYIEHVIEGDALVEILLKYKDELGYELRQAKAVAA